MGYFKIDRQIFDHYLWEDKPFSKGQAWIDLIGLANYEDGKAVYKSKVITCERGTVYRSISFLARRWGWSRKKTKAFIDLLVSDGMVTTKVTTHRTALTIVNYGKFQDLGTTKVATKVTTKEQQRNSKGSNERRRIKKKEEIYMANATHTAPPTLEEIREYCEKRNNGIDPEQFFDYYAMRDWKLSHGQPMTDWKASVRYWERNHKQKAKERHPDNDPAQKSEYWDVFDDLGVNK